MHDLDWITSLTMVLMQLLLLDNACNPFCKHYPIKVGKGTWPSILQSPPPLTYCQYDYRQALHYKSSAATIGIYCTHVAMQ